MKFKFYFAASLAALAVSASAQTHQEGAEYYKADQLDNAKELLLRNMNNSGTDKAVANYYLGRIALDENRIEEAQKFFEAGIQANPDFAYNHIGLGAAALRKGDKKLAESQFKKGESLVKKDAGAEIAIARAYYDADPVLYIKEIEKRVNNARKISKNQHPDIYIFEGDQEKDKKNWGAAAGKYEMAKSYDANATEAYVKYANLYTQVNPQFAVQMLKELLTINPNSALGQRELANAYYNKKDYADAAREYGVYVQNPNHFKQDEDRYALLLFSSQDFQKGYDYASKLLAENPGNFTARRFQFMNAANLPAMSDKLVPMAEELLAAHNANPTANKFAAIDYTLIAEEFNNAKRPDEAIVVLEEAIKEIPENANFNKQLALAYLGKEDYSGASDIFEGYIAKLENPDFNDYSVQATYSYYAGVQKKQDDPAKAEEYFKKTEDYAKKAEAALPGNYKPFKFYGDVAMQRAATDAEAKSVAFPMYSQAAELIEKSADPQRYARDAKTIYNYLGNYYLDNKDVAKAKENFNKYLQYDPNNDTYRKFVEGLKE